VLGRYPETSLAKARKLATEALGDLVDGVHPKARERAERRAKEQQERAERLAEATRQSNTFAALADQFVRRRASQKRTAVEIARIVNRYLVPRWGSRNVTEIRRADVIDMVEDIGERSGPHAARQALTYAATIFNYGCALEYGGIEQNPCRLVRATDLVGEARARQRVLTDSEIAKVWAAAEGYPAGPFIRLLILTGARRAEVAQMTWDEVNLDSALWTLAGARTKTGEPDEKPLSGMAVDLLKSLPRFTGPYVLSSSAGVRPFQAFSACKRSIDERVPDLGDWRIHDLRRSMRTGLAGLGVSPFIAELCIGHTQKGVHAVYDVHRYRTEKTDALERWASKIRNIVEPIPPNVVDLKGRKAMGA
jgi:integrase